MTFSAHKFGNFFPGTGSLTDIGVDEGKYYSVNYPLNDGVDDFTYQMALKPVLKEIMDRFKPNSIVLQCGADSLCGDRIGLLNLSIRGHGEIVRYVKSFGIPTVMIGGGGYSLRNVARCWAYETSIPLGIDLPNEIPENEFSMYYHPANKIHVQVSNQENKNSKAEIEDLTTQILDNLKNVTATKVDHSYYNGSQDTKIRNFAGYTASELA
jgi:histone deacetylase 1/2